MTIKVGLEALAVTANRFRPGERGPDPHIHRRHADVFWVLAGEVAVTLGAESLKAAAAR